MRQLGQSLAGTIKEIKDGQRDQGVIPSNYRGDWYEFKEPVSYSSANIIAVNNTTVNLANTFSVGNPIRFKQGGAYQYGYVWRVATNTLTIFTGSDYSLTSAAITDLAKGINSAPSGHPVLLKYDPSLTCIGATYTPGTPTGINYQFSMNGPLVSLFPYDFSGGSVSGSSILKFTLPVPAKRFAFGSMALLNSTRTNAIAYIYDTAMVPTNPELYGTIYKNVNEDPLVAGATNHFGNLFYTVGN